ncbi:uncharacterized protein TNCV_5135711 [Trichonephila clavipes]|nr:uncharacterized protein TNCV_5135711 [Trichonephila clavipes]
MVISDIRPEGLGSMLDVPSAHGTCSLNQWVRSLVGLFTSAGTGEYFPSPSVHFRNCGGGDRQSSLRGSFELKSHCQWCSRKVPVRINVRRYSDDRLPGASVTAPPFAGVVQDQSLAVVTDIIYVTAPRTPYGGSINRLGYFDTEITLLGMFLSQQADILSIQVIYGPHMRRNEIINNLPKKSAPSTNRCGEGRSGVSSHIWTSNSYRQLLQQMGELFQGTGKGFKELRSTQLLKPAAPPGSLCLTPAMKAKSLNWAKQWRDKDVDFWRSNKAQFMRRRRGEKFHSDCVVQTVKHPTKVMIWSVISGKGTGRLDVLKLEEWFPNGESHIFMQDGAPCHTARSIKTFLAEQNILLLDWPSNSPDMNTIENIWELMKTEVAKDVITNKTQLLERIIHVWNHHPQMQETVQSCIDSMPHRRKRKLDDAGASEINRLYPESRRKDENERPLSKFIAPQEEAGGRERPNEDETEDVTRARREERRKGGLNSPKTHSRSTKNAVGRRMLLFFAAGMKRKESARKNLQMPQQVERSWSQL